MLKPEYKENINLSNLNIMRVPYPFDEVKKNLRIAREKFPQEIAKKSKLLFLNSPHSPTGRAYSYEKLEEIVKYCLERRKTLCLEK